MGPKILKFPSNCLLISCMCWFALVKNIWGLLATSCDSTNSNDILADKLYILFGFISQPVRSPNNG